MADRSTAVAVAHLVRHYCSWQTGLRQARWDGNALGGTRVDGSRGGSLMLNYVMIGNSSRRCNQFIMVTLRTAAICWVVAAELNQLTNQLRS